MSNGARRFTGSGSIYQERGRWIAQVAIGPRGAQRKMRRTALTRAEAHAKLRDLQAARLFDFQIPDVADVQPFPRTAAGAISPRLPTTLERNYRTLAGEQGWIGIRSVPEARVAYRLARLGLAPQGVVTQAKVGRFRLDFAMPDVKVAIEVDGPMHRLPELAVKDLERDLWLVEQGWMVFRVDAYADEHQLQARLVRIARFIKSERLHGSLTDGRTPSGR